MEDVEDHRQDPEDHKGKVLLSTVFWYQSFMMS
jgi:hypothetical protein